MENTRIKEIKRLDEKCCELYSLWLFLEGLKDKKIEELGISEEELEKNHIFRLKKTKNL